MRGHSSAGTGFLPYERERRLREACLLTGQWRLLVNRGSSFHGRPMSQPLSSWLCILCPVSECLPNQGLEDILCGVFYSLCCCASCMWRYNSLGIYFCVGREVGPRGTGPWSLCRQPTANRFAAQPLRGQGFHTRPGRPARGFSTPPKGLFVYP